MTTTKEDKDKLFYKKLAYKCENILETIETHFEYEKELTQNEFKKIIEEQQNNE